MDKLSASPTSNQSRFNGVSEDTLWQGFGEF